MKLESLQTRIVTRGKEFFTTISGETPSIFNKGRWMGMVMDWCLKNEDFKVQLFRFVDVFPSLSTAAQLTGHIREYFAADDRNIPAALKWGAKSAGLGGAIGAKVLDAAIRSNIQQMARQFIVGENTRQAVATLEKLRQQGFAFVVDVLGESTLSEQEAEQYVATYLELLSALKEKQSGWKPFAGGGQTGADLDWGHSPKVNLSIKPSALYSQARPVDFEGSVRSILARAKRIFEQVRQIGGFMCIDMESYKYKDITLEVFRRLRCDEQFCDYPHLGIALQCYLRRSDRDLEELLCWAEKNKLPISVRLVKGAYWDYETVLARQNGWEVPVYTQKAETDAAYERQAWKILQNHRWCHLACASHNIRTITAVMEMAAELGVPEERYEFQVLYGMAEPVRKGLLKVAERVRLYCPYGQLIPGMAYLVRRLLENTANESFLRRSFAEQSDIEKLLEDPREILERQRAEPGLSDRGGADGFTNEPAVSFTRPQTRRAFVEAIAAVRSNLGKTYPLFIGGRDVLTEDTLSSVNPANPLEVIGQVCQAGKEQVQLAVAAAKDAFCSWRDTPVSVRADYLYRAADIARKRVFELSAWQVLEVGKQWDQAYADVTEAIDFLRYYAQEMTRLSQPRHLGQVPGEVNIYFYEPRGLAAVIAPWNFPLAIGCGMCAAAIVAGNCVVYKPSGLSAVVGNTLLEIFRQAGLPGGVFNYTPGRGSVIGDLLIEHPDVSLIAFTGSMEVGLRIIEKAAVVRTGQGYVKRVIAEMGGKNAIIIDDDADLDEAVPAVLWSAFGFQGQKCSACSRVIVLQSAYERFCSRLKAAAQSLKIGPAEDPANLIGPVVDAEAQKRILQYIEIGKKEGRLIYSSPVPGTGYYVPLTIIEGIKPEHIIAREEIFGPVLAVMQAKDFEQALQWANSTKFALTGGVFSRSPEHLARARREFRVGNLYLNRQITGALVQRQPFGGSRMSGVGSKAGGPDYLLQFMDARTVTENTMRRGFTPVAGNDGIDRNR
jgi:RHH-type proline utilization regulon transcriptional repressor/proline dehydrogenase/delta 1-pyrroline-5-carboxylate dehydrogenase